MFAPFVTALVLTGCQHATMSPPAALVAQPIHRAAKVYIVAPRDAASGARQYAGSGGSVAVALETAFNRNGGSASVGAHVASRADALSAARESRCDYVVLPEIAPAEDQSGSAINDNLVLSVQVLRVADGSEVSRTEIPGEASSFTFGGDHPQDLLGEPIDKFVSALF